MAEERAKWWQRFGTGAQIAQAAIAAFGFGAVLLQVNEIRYSNRAASARQVYLAYLDLEFRYPQFATPDYARIKAGDADTRSRYESFVSYLLYACEEALVAFGNRPEWRTSCDNEVRQHVSYLCEKSASDPVFLNTVSADMAAFVRSVMTRAGVVPPACTPKGA